MKLRAYSCTCFLAILAVAWVPSIRAQDNEIGIYYDMSGTLSCREDGLYQQLTCYVVVKNCTFTSGISGWEAQLTADSGIFITQGELYGQGVNIFNFPDLSVGLRSPLPYQDNIVLMSFSVFAVNSGGLYLGPASRSSLPEANAPVIADGDDPGTLVPCSYRVDPNVGPLASVGLSCSEEGRSAFRSEGIGDVLMLTEDGDCGEDTTPPSHLGGWDIPLTNPWGIAVGDDVVFVTDPVQDRILRYDAAGQLGTYWTCDHEPHWVRWDGSHQNLYVSYNLNQPKVQVFSPDGTLRFEIGGYPLSHDPGHFSGNVGAIAVDEGGYLYIEETSAAQDPPFQHRIQVFDWNGVFQRVFAVSSGYATPPVAGQWFQCNDMDIASNGDLLLLDGSTGIPGQNYPRVHRFSAGGTPFDIWGENGSGPGQLGLPFNLRIGGDSGVWISSVTRLIKFTIDGEAIFEINNFDPPEFEGIDVAAGAIDYVYAGMFDQNASQHQRVEIFSAPILAHNILDSAWQGPNYHLITGNLELLCDCDASDNRKMDGVAADGVAPLLLRHKFGEPCTVEWWLTDPVDGSDIGKGSLSTLDGIQIGDEVSTSTEIVNGEYISFVVYSAPEDFDRLDVPDDGNRAQRQVRVHFRYTASISGETGEVWRDLTVIRPPVEFLHGLWAGPQAWYKFDAIKNDPRWNLSDGTAIAKDVDYSNSNGSGFEHNAGQLANKLQADKAALRAKKFAAAKVDVVSHSMGSCIARALAAAPQGTRADNYGAGDFHKVLTLNGPHWGSGLAEWVHLVIELAHSTNTKVARVAHIALRLLSVAMGTSYDQIVGDAIQDLRPGSEALLSQPAFNVPTHVHAGTGGSDLAEAGLLNYYAFRDKSAAAFVLLHDFLGVPELSTYDQQQHDAIVLLESQSGGITGPQRQISSGFSGLHTQATSAASTEMIANAWAVAQTTDQSYFAHLPPPSSSSSKAKETLPDLPEYAGKRILLVASTGTAVPGQQVSIAVQGIEGAQIAKAFIAYPGGGQLLEAPNLSTTLTIPQDASGAIDLECLAILADGTLVDGEPVTIDVDLSALTLQSISIEPSSVTFASIGSLQTLTLLGLYSDNTWRDLKPYIDDMDISYNHFVIAWHPETATVQALATGSTLMQVTLYGHQASVTVSVGDREPINNAPHAEAGEDAEYCAGRPFTLDASGSYDYDTAIGDQLFFAWDINGDGQYDDAFGQQPSISIPVEDGDLVVGLRVTDSLGLSSEDYCVLRSEGGFCHEGIGYCEVGHGSPQYSDFSFAGDIELDSAGNFYVFDYAFYPVISQRVLKFTSTCAFVAQLSLPLGLAPAMAVTPSATILMVDLSDVTPLVRKYDMNGELLPPITLPGLPEDRNFNEKIASDSVGNMLLCADTNGITPDNGWGLINQYIYTIDQVGNILRVLDVGNDLGIAISNESSIVDYECTGEGDIFLATQHAVYKADYSSGYSLGMTIASPGMFSCIRGLAVGSNGSVYTADECMNMVRWFSPSGTLVSSRTGVSGAEPSQFGAPQSICVDNNDRIYVAEQYNRRAQVFQFVASLVDVPDCDGSAPGSGADARMRPTLEIIGGGLGAGGRIEMAMEIPRGPMAIKMGVYDVRGRKVKSLVNDVREKGNHKIMWDGRDQGGRNVSSGVYVVRMEGAGIAVVRKVVIVR